jgi:hypothetical protein
MSLLRGLERRLEWLVDSLARRVFPGGYHSSELWARLAREADLSEYETPAGPAIANLFRLTLNPDDIKVDLTPLRIGLEQELSSYATARGWRLEGPVALEIITDPTRRRRRLACRTEVRRGELPVWAHLRGATTYEVRPNRASIGRAESCDVVVAAEEVSRTHAVIYRQGERFWLKDQSSTNGTWVDGTRLGERAVELAPGSTLLLAGVRLRFDPCPT